MLSLIVCSVNPAYLKGLQESVAATIGVEHEWLVWDNREANMGLCSVYNRMAAQARFPLLCFLHEDLLFKTGDWGRYLSDLFADGSVGMLGIAGSSYKSRLLSGWYSGGGAKDYSHIIHRNGNEEYALSFPEQWIEKEPRVVCIDGVFMVVRRQLWNEVQFNEEVLKGFHFYDIDFSLRIAQRASVVVSKQIEIIHLTVGGDFGDKWVDEAFSFHGYARNWLPASVTPLNEKRADTKVARYWLDWLKNQPVSLRNRLRWVQSQSLLKSAPLWYSVIKFLAYRPLRMKYIHHYFKKK